MVCNNERARFLNFVERAIILGVSYERARFLASCAHGEEARIESNRTKVIPYDPAVQIKEAFRIGIGLKDTANMMQMSKQEIMSYGLPFSDNSAFKNPSRSSTVYNLLSHDNQEQDVRSLK